MLLSFFCTTDHRMVKAFCKNGTKMEQNTDIILSHTVATAPPVARSYSACLLPNNSSSGELVQYFCLATLPLISDRYLEK